MSHLDQPHKRSRSRFAQQAARLALGGMLSVALGLVAAPGALAAFSVQKLRLSTKSGAEDYLYTAGNTVVEQATVNSGRYYRFDVYDPSAKVHLTTACRPAPGNGVVTGTYVVQSGDPLSNATAWRFRLREFKNTSTC